jgi:transcriptional regulator with XRE-family HTH domain
MDQITKENCSEAIDRICEEASITKKQLAEILGVSPSSIVRIQKVGQKAGDEFINRLKALQVLGYAKYKELLSSNENIDPKLLSGKVLTISGVLTGLTAVISLKSVATAVTVSIPLLGLGSAVAGGLLAGGIFNSISKLCKKNKLNCEEKNGNLEIKPI